MNYTVTITPPKSESQKMTDTPRTDAELHRILRERYHETPPINPVVPADFARTLERELADANARANVLLKTLRDLYEAERSQRPTGYEMKAAREAIEAAQ